MLRYLRKQQGLLQLIVKKKSRRRKYLIIKNWLAVFRLGRTSKNGAERSGRLNDAIIPEIMRQVRKIVLEDQRVKRLLRLWAYQLGQQ